MEEEGQIPEEEIKTPKRVKLTYEKIKEMSDRMLQPAAEEQKARDVKRIIRAIKDPNLVTKGTKKETEMAEEVANLQRRKSIERNRESLRSLYKLSELKLPNVAVETLGFGECMSAPRPPKLDETESETTFERLSNDSESIETKSFLDLMNSDTDEEVEGDKKPVKDRKDCTPGVKVPPSEDEIIPGSKKRKLKRWKPKVRQSGLPPDDLVVEFVEGLTNSLKEVGIFEFMNAWLLHLYGMNPRPKDPVSLLRDYIAESLGSSGMDSGATGNEDTLEKRLKEEDEIMVETSKLLHLAHLLAPQIYDPDGNMILYESSVEEEQFVDEEESLSPNTEATESAPSSSKHHHKIVPKSHTTLKKLKSKMSTGEINKSISKIVKSKLKKKKSVSRIKNIK